MKRIRKNKFSKKLDVREIAYLGMMTATLEGAKIALSFLPNIELVSFFIILYAVCFGKKVLYAVFTFVGIECMVWGMGVWVFMYLYIWPLLCLLALQFKRQKSAILWAVFSGIFGLTFGALCSLIYLGIGGPKMAFTWWIAGIPYDIIHGLSNFVLMLILYHPVSHILQKIKMYGINE
ncbi:MAG: hypothetical protein HFI37_05775 [Lachnospiraceae bacterium]|nr:hypothetical protein [Lachnospiraceae bacterium]